MRARRLIGLPLVNLSNKKSEGYVRDLLFELEPPRLIGIVVENGTWFKNSKEVDFSKVFSVGEDAITIIDQDAARMEASEFDESSKMLYSKLLSMEVKTNTGRLLGSLTDILMAGDDGSVKKIEISDSILTDIFKGRFFVEAGDSLKAEKDNLIIRESSEAVRNG